MKICRLNSDKEAVVFIREGLKARGGFCPCLVEKTPDTKCPCKNYKERQECHCGLFICEEKDGQETL